MGALRRALTVGNAASLLLDGSLFRSRHIRRQNQETTFHPNAHTRSIDNSQCLTNRCGNFNFAFRANGNEELLHTSMVA
jgi:hypothetical protein